MTLPRFKLPLATRAPAVIKNRTAGTGRHSWFAKTAMRIVGYVMTGM
jgi:hypothetical protein